MPQRLTNRWLYCRRRGVDDEAHGSSKHGMARGNGILYYSGWTFNGVAHVRASEPVP